MNHSILNRLQILLTEAFTGLSVRIESAELSKMASLIHSHMDHDGRIYHTSEHLFDLCAGLNPRQIMAALWHDIIYQQLDEGYNGNTVDFITNLGVIDQEALILSTDLPDDFALRLCLCVFGYKAGERIQLNNGANEFLSAWHACQILSPYLPANELLAIAALIEATIPFRGPDPFGNPYPEELAARVKMTAAEFNLEISPQEQITLLKDAVELANRDVANFASTDPGYFLSTTWQLLQEYNPVLKGPDQYTIQEYRISLLSMDKFLRSLNPEFIFHQYRDSPDYKRFSVLQKAAHDNIRFSIDYINAKIAGIGLIEALALLSGGDCAISSFLGKHTPDSENPCRASDFLPSLVEYKPENNELFNALENGRSQPCDYDLNDSPFSAYMYKYLGQAGIMQVANLARQMFAGIISPQIFLNSMEQPLVKNAAAACAQIMDSRAIKLYALGNEAKVP